MPRLPTLLLTLTATAAVPAAPGGHSPTPRREATMTARGTFDVKLTPQQDDSAAGPFGRLLIEKQYHGDLEGTGRGQMLGARTAVAGSAGYVALELVTGTLQGKHGSFMLQHSGTMTRNTPSLRVTIVPDSGTDQLTGISGTLDIIIAGSAHSYVLEYSLGGH